MSSRKARWTSSGDRVSGDLEHETVLWIMSPCAVPSGNSTVAAAYHAMHKSSDANANTLNSSACSRHLVFSFL